jgi:hypothetical protein
MGIPNNARLACRHSLPAFGLLLCLGVAAPLQASTQDCERRLMPSGINDADRELVRTAALLGQAELDPEVVRRASAIRAQGGRCIGATALGFSRARPRSQSKWAIGLLPLQLYTTYNSGYPRDENNGALWAGKGISGSLDAGVHVRLGPLSAAVAPTATFSTNDAFPLASSPGFPPYGAAVGGIDLPQRFGSESLHRIDPGQSYVRIDLLGFAAGFATENLWWGPQRFFPVLMSSSGAGFPHLFVGTGRPVDIGIGRLTADLIWGRLTESDFFDNDSANNRRLFGGLVLGFQPKPLPGLTIGGSRVNHEFEQPGMSLSEILRAPYVDLRGNFLDNQLLSVFGRWAFVGAGFEMYFEWGRDDHWINNDDLLKTFEHTQVYSIGFQKAVTRDRDWWRVYGELGHLGAGYSYRGRSTGGTGTFYLNVDIPQGHTVRGQMLGAWIGPGSDAQILGVDRLAEIGEVGLFVERVRYNSDLYYERWSNQFVDSGYDVEITAGGHWLRRTRSLEYKASGALSRRWNRSFLSLERGQPDAEWNLHLELLASWRP